MIQAAEIVTIGERERAALVRFLGATFGGALDPEDIAQEALLRAFNGRASFDPARASLAGWLRAIASNVATDLLRRRARVRFVPLEAAAERAAPARAPGRGTDDRLLAAVRSALDEIPERERRAFHLFHDDGLPVAAVARRLRAPEGTVKSWLHRARKRLRLRLALAAGAGALLLAVTIAACDVARESASAAIDRARTAVAERYGPLADARPSTLDSRPSTAEGVS